MSRPISVLLVEDDTDLREVLADLLTDEGCHVAAKVDGKDAIDHLKTGFRPDIILLDLMMPRMDGWAFRKAQLADPELSPIPVIVLSASAKLLEGTLFLKKPFDAGHLIRMVKEQIPVQER